jgi:hypothetical protein
LKYWVIDSAATRVLARAAAARAKLDSDLKAISAIDPALVAAIGGEIDALTEPAQRAGRAYSGDDCAAGNALPEQAKGQILNARWVSSRRRRPHRPE